MRHLGAVVGVVALLALAGCTGDPDPVITTIVTVPPPASADAQAPSASAQPTATEGGNLLGSGVGFTVAATQTAESSTDAAGVSVSYDAENIADGDPATAWRKASGEWRYEDYILITFDAPVTLTEVGLIPGYAKIDPTTGTDRFLQNHRLASVLWTFSDGSTWTQEFDDEPTMQSIPVAGEVTWVRIGQLWQRWDEEPAATRDYLAISDVSLVGAPVE